MKIEEIRIGNLLIADIGNVKVESVLGSTFRIYAHSLDEEYLADYPAGDLRPIELTEDYLVRLGFEKSEMHKDCYNNDIAIHGRPDIGFVYSASFFEHDNLISIKYVHQLQNLYHALTGEELKLPQP